MVCLEYSMVDAYQATSGLITLFSNVNGVNVSIQYPWQIMKEYYQKFSAALLYFRVHSGSFRWISFGGIIR